MATDITIDLALKLGGAVSGSVLGLAFQPPKDRKEAITRGAFTLLSGILFADVTHAYLKWPDSWQMDLAAAAGTALFSWFLMGAAVRFINVWRPPSK